MTTRDPVAKEKTSVDVSNTSASHRQPAREIPLRGMRGAIAQAMSYSLREMAQFTLHRQVAIGRLLEERERDPVRPSVNTLILAAVARTLPAFPAVNATVEDGIIRQWAHVDLGVAIALDGGLVVPVVRDADKLSLADIGASVKDLAAQARTGRFAPADLAGATFTVTNLGAFGIDAFTPIINPPQAAILGVGRASGGAMWLSLTIDHRALDGAPGAQFLGALAALIEDAPANLLDDN